MYGTMLQTDRAALRKGKREREAKELSNAMNRGCGAKIWGRGSSLKRRAEWVWRMAGHEKRVDGMEDAVIMLQAWKRTMRGGQQLGCAHYSRHSRLHAGSSLPAPGASLVGTEGSTRIILAVLEATQDAMAV